MATSEQNREREREDAARFLMAHFKGRYENLLRSITFEHIGRGLVSALEEFEGDIIRATAGDGSRMVIVAGDLGLAIVAHSGSNIDDDEATEVMQGEVRSRLLSSLRGGEIAIRTPLEEGFDAREEIKIHHAAFAGGFVMLEALPRDPERRTEILDRLRQMLAR